MAVALWGCAAADSRRDDVWDLTSGQPSALAKALPHRSHLLLVRRTCIMLARNKEDRVSGIDQSAPRITATASLGNWPKQTDDHSEAAS